MLRQHGTKIDWLEIAIVTAMGLCCLWSPLALAQNVGTISRANNPALSISVDSVFVGSLMEDGIPPKAIRSYLRAVRELHQGHTVAAEKDANRAARLDAKFADADALAATGALAQQQFDRARGEAADAVCIDAADEKAWVVLATADNYLGKYSEAIDALGHVRRQNQVTWQVAYQWARAEAGQNHAQQTLEWVDRAALSAPSSFAPLHLLRASALLAASQNAAAANELETYLQLLGKNAPQRERLTRELHRLQETSQRQSATETGTERNALAN